MLPDGPTKFLNETFQKKPEKGPPPKLTSNSKAEWFEYWDEGIIIINNNNNNNILNTNNNF